MRIDRPANTDTCASERCNHTFGKHYLTHDQQSSGCSVVDADGEKGTVSTQCRCPAFLVRYVYKPRTRAAKVKS